MVSIEQNVWGMTPEGEAIILYTLRNDKGAEVQLSNFGAAIVAVNLIFAPVHLFAAPYWISLCTFFPGLVMGWLKYRHDSLLPPALFHFLGNVWAIWFFPSPVGF